ncbi:MAG: N-acetylglutaminylglutamine synthetase [Desulfococcaceae bacterium]|nr:N-acetylglutaminylglutamine synthetase [Desulfococcaceae bacterium]
MGKHHHMQYRLDRKSGASVSSWQQRFGPDSEKMKENASVDMGWGRLIFGQTFGNNEKLAKAIRAEEEKRRDIAFYIRDPHVLLSMAPNELFLDPSHTYRMWVHSYRPDSRQSPAFNIRRLLSEEDARAVNRLYAARGMVRCDPDFLLAGHATKLRTYFIAESLPDGQIIGTVTGVDHAEAFQDAEKGSSLWCLAVDPQSNAPGVGEALVRHLLEHYFTRGRDYTDLSVMHDNREAIRLYEKIGFQRVPVFCIKRKNPINEKLYTAPLMEEKLNPYARLLTDEARRRGISVEVLDAEYGYFRLHSGGRSVICRESLTELTSAIAMSRCDDKRVTHRLLKSEGLRVPLQYINEKPQAEEGKSWVVKPARGEQGDGISVDLRTDKELDHAIALAQRECRDYIVEEYVQGEDLRIIVIDFKTVAAAVRKAPQIVGTGTHSVTELIEKYNRRRKAATGGESSVPLDAETRRCAELEGYTMDSVLPPGIGLQVRKTANLHTGGTIHDVTVQLHPRLSEAAERAAKALDIPVTGLDFIVPDISGPEYAVIEANERPGLANHEPQPTAERFIDLLFPRTITGELHEQTAH